MTAIPPLKWVQALSMWYSKDGRYVILKSTLPEMREKPTEIYTLRKRDVVSAHADPTTLGHHLAERYTLSDAQREAQVDAWRDAQGAGRHVPEDYPAVALKRFFWPISDGCTRAALAIVDRGGATYAEVIGMVRDGDDNNVPVTYATIKLTPTYDAAPNPERHP